MGATSIDNYDLLKQQVEEEITRMISANDVVDASTIKTTVAKGNVVEVVKQTSTLSVSTQSELEEMESDVISFDKDYVVMVEKAVAPLMAKRFIDDADWDTVNMYNQEIARAFVDERNSDFLTALDDGVDDDNVFPVVVAWSTATTAIIEDLSYLNSLLETNNFGRGKKALIMHPTAYHYLRSVEGIYSVSTSDMNTLKTGFVDDLFNSVILTTTECTTGTVYLVDTEIGAVRHYEREPVTVDIEELKSRRAIRIPAYTRYAFYVVRPTAIACLTGVVA